MYRITGVLGMKIYFLKTCILVLIGWMLCIIAQNAYLQSREAGLGFSNKTDASTQKQTKEEAKKTPEKFWQNCQKCLSLAQSSVRHARKWSPFLKN